jgi:hypothetical protein
MAKNTTSWSAVYEDFGGALEQMDPNEIGDDPPDEVLTQFHAAAEAAATFIASKAVGVDTNFDVDLSGKASPGHDHGDEVTISIRQTKP